MHEDKLLEKLRSIEALFAGAATAGEKDAAGHARQRILDRIKSWERKDPAVEHQFSISDPWSRKVFVSLLRRYQIEPYRRPRQRHSTVMARVSKGFVGDTLWPEFQEISATLRAHLTEITDRVISSAIHKDSSEPELISTPKRLPAGSR